MNKITKNLIQLTNKTLSWKEAIQIAFEPLINYQYCSKKYVDQAIENIEKLGDYVVLFNQAVFPHARPEKGAIKTGFAITIFQKPITFPSGKKVTHFVPFVAMQNNGHIKVLQSFAKIFNSTQKQEAFIKTKTKEDVIIFWKGASDA